MESEQESPANLADLTMQIASLEARYKALVQHQNAEKFTATGRIARTIAHEIRNPLTNINLAVEQLVTEVPVDDSTRFLFEMISRNSKRINHIVSDLLHSTRFADLAISDEPLNDILRELLLEVSEKATAEKVKVVHQFDPMVANVKIDKEKFKQAVINLVLNALEAMQGQLDGVLTVTTSQEADGVAITVADNGKGLSAEESQRIFEPYFTKKQAGQGLSLTTTQNIILNHKGKINFATAPNEGTTFTIKLYG